MEETQCTKAMVCSACLEKQRARETFIKLGNLEDDVTIYHYLYNTSCNQSGSCTPDNTDGLIIIHNPKNRTIDRTTLINKIGQGNAKCPFCRHFMQKTRDLLNAIDLQNKDEVIGICGECKRRQSSDHLNKCPKCEKAKLNFMRSKLSVEANNEVKIERYLAKVKDVLETLLLKQKRKTVVSSPKKSLSVPNIEIGKEPIARREPVICDLLDCLAKRQAHSYLEMGTSQGTLARPETTNGSSSKLGRKSDETIEKNDSGETKSMKNKNNKTMKEKGDGSGRLASKQKTDKTDQNIDGKKRSLKKQNGKTPSKDNVADKKSSKGEKTNKLDDGGIDTSANDLFSDKKSKRFLDSKIKITKSQQLQLSLEKKQEEKRRKELAKIIAQAKLAKAKEEAENAKKEKELAAQLAKEAAIASADSKPQNEENGSKSKTEEVERPKPIKQLSTFSQLAVLNKKHAGAKECKPSENLGLGTRGDKQKSPFDNEAQKHISNFDISKIIDPHSSMKITASKTIKPMNSFMKVMHTKAEELKNKLTKIDEFQPCSIQVPGNDEEFKAKYFGSLPSVGAPYVNPPEFMQFIDIPSSHVFLSDGVKMSPQIVDLAADKVVRGNQKRKKVLKGCNVEYQKLPKVSEEHKTPTPLLFKASHCVSQVATATKSDSETDDNDKTEKTSRGGISYALSDEKYIRNGWTKLPKEREFRKVDLYEMNPPRDTPNWFQRHASEEELFYKNGKKLAEFLKDGSAVLYYSNGFKALEYHLAEEHLAGYRYTIFKRPGNCKEPSIILASFDGIGNGIVYDRKGNVRLKYNQCEGTSLDKNLGPVTNWKWHTLNEQKEYQLVMIDTFNPVKDKLIQNYNLEKQKAVVDEEVLEIERQNTVIEIQKKMKQNMTPFQIKPKTVIEIQKKMKQNMTPFQIKPKTVKINECFSLKIQAQSKIILNFEECEVVLKFDLGLVLNPQKIVGQVTEEIDRVFSSHDHLPAPCDSINKIQRLVANAKVHAASEQKRADWINRPLKVFQEAKSVPICQHAKKKALKAVKYANFGEIIVFD